MVTCLGLGVLVTYIIHMLQAAKLWIFLANDFVHMVKKKKNKKNPTQIFFKIAL